jgi:hypothetical protein
MGGDAMTDKQPEALRLADGLEQGFQTGSISAQLDQAAAELRRLHEVNAELVEALEWVATVNAMDYEYQSRAKQALAKATGEQNG